MGYRQQTALKIFNVLSDTITHIFLFYWIKKISNLFITLKYANNKISSSSSYFILFLVSVVRGGLRLAQTIHTLGNCFLGGQAQPSESLLQVLR